MIIYFYECVTACQKTSEVLCAKLFFLKTGSINLGIECMHISNIQYLVQT